jgi:hypothetical protein
MSKTIPNSPKGWSAKELAQEAAQAEQNALSASLVPVRDCWLRIAAIYRTIAMDADRTGGDRLSSGIRPALTAKQKLALTAFELRTEVRSYQLPTFVGPKTMAQLVDKGLVELIDPSPASFSRSRWRLSSNWQNKA